MAFRQEGLGLITNDAQGKPWSTPTCAQVCGFDFDIRTEVAKLMRAGVDWHTAIKSATLCPRLFFRSFQAKVSVTLNAPENRKISAPGFFGSSSSSAPKRDNAPMDRPDDELVAAGKSKN